MNRWWMALLVGLAASLAGAVSPQPGAELEAFKRNQGSRSRAADANGIYNAFVAAQVAFDGRFNFGAFPAGAATNSGHSFNLSFAWPGTPGTSYTTIRVDGEDFIFGSGGTFLQPPTHVGDTSTTIWQINDIKVTQTLKLSAGPGSDRVDKVSIGYVAENLGTVSHSIGVRVMMDTMLAGNDSAGFEIPGLGMISTEQLFSGPDVPVTWQLVGTHQGRPVAAQGVLSGNEVHTPNQFAIANWSRLQSQPFDFAPATGQPTGDGGVAIWWLPMDVPAGDSREVATLYGVGPTTESPLQLLVNLAAPEAIDLSQPGPVAIGLEVENLTTNTVPQVTATLEVPPGVTVAPAATLALGDLAPGQSVPGSWQVTIPPNTPPGFYDVAVVVQSTDPNFAPLRLEGEVELIAPPTGVVDPSQSEIRLLDRADPLQGLFAQGGPVEFEIIARTATGDPVANVHPTSIELFADPATGVSFEEIEDSTDEDGVTFGALFGLAAGEHTIRAEINGQPLPMTLQVTFVRFDDVPVFCYYNLPVGLHLLANPLLTVDRLDPPTADIVAWDAAARSYVSLESLAALAPGQGAFVRAYRQALLAVAGFLPTYPEAGRFELVTFGASTPGELPERAALSPSPEAEAVLELVGEWNLVGNPFPADLEWDLTNFEVLVDGQPVGLLADPTTWQYVDPYLFIFDGSQYQLVFDPSIAGFEHVRDRVPLLQGAWIRRTPSEQTVALRALTQPDAPEPQDGSNGRATRSSGWAVGLTARAGGETATATFGFAGRALAMQKPPAMGTPKVDLTLLQGPGRLAGDLRSGSPTQRWVATVTAPPGELVALDWASLGRNLPAGLTAVLTDLQNGRRLSMRTRSSYGYTSQGETRQFAIEVDRQSGERLRPTLSATPGRSRGATLTLNLNVPATIRLQVTSLTGRPVRSLLQQTAGSGLTAFNWDGRDNQNRPVPAGTYQVVVIAEADGGEVARATTQVTVR